MLERIAQVGVCWCFAFREKLAVIFQDAFDNGDIGFIAFDEQFMPASADANAEQGFEEFDVLILWPEESF
ncbi:MAG TPA: hypothetical protein VFZ34_17940 [Blastocatellia bacterium]|nr:hypothetical protein [Blastocatellia bacterium]